MANKRYFVRVRGKILGPFDVAHLKQQRDRGQLSSFHEVSEDRVHWEPASAVAELFPPEPERRPVEITAVTPSRPQAAGRHAEARVDVMAVGEDWHYADDREETVGPVSYEKLLDLLDREKINPQTLVWNKSMTDWQPLESVPGLLTGVTVSPRKPLRQGNPLALLSLIGALVWLGGLGSGAAVVLGVLALRGSRLLAAGRRQRASAGRWMAVTGIVVGSIGFVVTLVLIPVLYFAHPSNLNPEQISARYKEKVYLLENAGGTGSGILLANSRTHGLIGTNLHVVSSELKKLPRHGIPENGIKKTLAMTAKNPSQVDGRLARVAAIHRTNDLALLVLDMPNVEPDAVPVIRKHRLRDGESAVALGYPLGQPFNVTSGLISSTGGERGLVWTTCSISPGNSGGPLFLQRQALLAGLNTLIMIGDLPPGIAQNLNGAEPAEELVVPLQAGRTEKWVWASDLRERVLELVKMVPVRD